MSRLSTDLIQPCLLDRLCDDDPKSTKESNLERSISMSQFRDAVLRDLGWLLNASAHSESELEDFPAVQDSVVNYGIRELSGVICSSIDPYEFAKYIEERLRVFEPRLDPRKLRVHMIEVEHPEESTTLKFEITGDVWARPLPEPFYAMTEVDLETGALILQK